MLRHAPLPAPALAPPSGSALGWGAIAVGSAAIAIFAQIAGVPLLILAPLIAIAGLMVWRNPLWWGAMLPIFVIPPPVNHVPPHEVGLAVVIAMLVVAGLSRRATWLTQLDPIEVAVALLVGWALFTGMWCDDKLWYLFQARKMAVGLLALWAAIRIAKWVPRDDLMLGTCLAAFGTAVATVARAATVGWFVSSHPVARTTATDIGWGSSNYITAVLVLMAPSALRVALRDPRPFARLLGWTVLPLVALVATISGSRGGAVLIVLMALLVVGTQHIQHRHLWTIVLLTLVFLVVGPGGSYLIGRFTHPVEFVSVATRFHFFDIGWARLLDNLPWGMGLGQGIVYRDLLFGGDPHNYLLGMGSELGIPGLVLWFIVLALIWGRTRSATRLPQSAFDGMTLRVTVVIAVVNSLFEPTFLGPHYHFLFYWVVGTFLGLPAAPEPVAPDERPAPRPLT